MGPWSLLQPAVRAFKWTLSEMQDAPSGAFALWRREWDFLEKCPHPLGGLGFTNLGGALECARDEHTPCGATDPAIFAALGSAILDPLQTGAIRADDPLALTLRRKGKQSGGPLSHVRLRAIGVMGQDAAANGFAWSPFSANLAP